MICVVSCICSTRHCKVVQLACSLQLSSYSHVECLSGMSVGYLTLARCRLIKGFGDAGECCKFGGCNLLWLMATKRLLFNLSLTLA